MPFLFVSNELEQTSSILRISGPDAYTYLQGQFTQDLNQPPGSAGYGLWLNQRGKVVADSFILRTNDNEFIVASFSTRVALLRERLESYIVADEVEVADETLGWAWLKLWGDGAGSPLAALSGSAAGAGQYADIESSLAFRGAGGSGDHFEWLVPRAGGEALAARLIEAGAEPVGRPVAERERILSAIPAVPSDIGPGDLPNEAGLEETAISHTKGCYLGQEVMARLKNLGQVRRRLHVVRGPGAPPSPHTALHQAGRKIGETRSAAPVDGGFVAMAMLNLLYLDPAAGVGFAPAGPAGLHVVRRV